MLFVRKKLLTGITSGFPRARLSHFASVYAIFLSLILASAGVRAGPELQPWVDAGEATFPSPVEVTAADMGFISSQFMWYCAGKIECPGTSGTTTAAFQRQFNLPSLQRPFVRGSITILADDYFSLYINNSFVGSEWLDNRYLNGKYEIDINGNFILDANGNPIFIPAVPVTYNLAQFYDYLNFGGINTISIFACDGYPPIPNITPALGSPTSGGFDGCPQPSQRGNHWLLVQGNIEESQNGGNGPYLGINNLDSGANFGGGNEFGWLVSSAVPEPATLPLMSLGLFGLLLGQWRRSRIGGTVRIAA
jgi:hypothetical protein